MGLGRWPAGLILATLAGAACENDGLVPTTDDPNSQLTLDAGRTIAPKDGGVVFIDGGIRHIDGGAMVRELDGGVSLVDGGVVLIDGGVMTIDGGVAPIDGGAREIDAGRWHVDGGVAYIDGGVREIDGGVVVQDGGRVNHDGGVLLDCGVPGSEDGGTLRLLGTIDAVVTTTRALEPRLALSGSQVALVWVEGERARADPRAIKFQLVAADLSRVVSTPRTVTSTSGGAQSPALAWAAGIFGLAWVNLGPSLASDTLDFRELAGDGVPRGSVRRLAATSATNPDLIWTGSEFGATWTDSSGTTEFTTFTATTGAASPLRLSSAATPAVAWTGTEYALAFRQAISGMPGLHRLYLARLSRTLAPLLPWSEIAIHSLQFCCRYDQQKLAWSGDEFGLLHADPDEVLSLSRVGRAGTVLGTTTQISSSQGRSGGTRDASYRLAWTGSGWIVGWTMHGQRQGVRLRRVSADGRPIDFETAVSHFPSDHTSLVWTGSAAVIAWIEFQAGAYTIKLARYGLCR